MEMDRILGDELLEEVLRRLHPHSSFSSSTADVSFVSKRWLRLYRSSKSRLDLSLCPFYCTGPSLSSFLSHFPHLSFLHIVIPTVAGYPFSAFPDQILHSISSSCTKLTTLHLDHAPVSLSPLLSLSNSCPHLTDLSISLSTSFSLHWLRFFRSLQTLSISFGYVLGESKHVDDDASGGKYFDAELKIENLTMSYTLRGYGFDWLWRSCKSLKKLQLVRCEGVGDDTSVSSFVNCFKGLREVELRSCGFVVHEILSEVLVNCTSLNSLLIFNMASSYGLLHQFITHSGCSLQQLDLCVPHDLINNHFLSAVADRFRGLLSLRLNMCHLVTGEGLRTMVLAMTNELQELALIDCKVEPGLLTILGQRFRNLRNLDLSKNRMLVDNEFISMLASCNCLRELRVRRCEGLTNASVVSMFKSCKQLERVDIMNCPGIDAEGVELFVLNCPGLRRINVEEDKLSDVSRSWASKKLVECSSLTYYCGSRYIPRVLFVYISFNSTCFKTKDDKSQG
ncbi:hypothetical protein Vadar_016312 [Vaccinium darrowii]|uniref:Uncharacterized protein n=1 Tax=Vaccinium darrowii TaxID=229202 RepID=A0ACB7YG22_9ERIC|nr:hypothetical protein Vadar_016312 [Vaccinium darrowii]